jgi:hypothetical protein
MVFGVRVGEFLQNQIGGDGVELEDTGGEPSTQAEGCSFSTNEKKFHGTFDDELIEGTAKGGKPRRVRRGGCDTLVLVVKRTPDERVFSEWMARLRVDSRCALVSIPTLLRGPYLCLASPKTAQIWAERMAKGERFNAPVAWVCSRSAARR